MTTAIVPANDTHAMVCTPEQLELAKRTVFPDSTNDEFALFLHECNRRKVHPLDRMLYPQKRNGKVVFVSSIDWFRSKAEESGELAGNDDPVPTYDDGNRLVSCSVTVWRIVKGVRCPFTATARWSEYYPGEKQGFMWTKMPVLMLGKCAEALALRKAFPSLLAGAYTHDEMAQADNAAPVKSHDEVSLPPQKALPPVVTSEASTYQLKPPVARAAAAKKSELVKQMDAALNKPEPEKFKTMAGSDNWPVYYVYAIYPPKDGGSKVDIYLGEQPKNGAAKGVKYSMFVSADKPEEGERYATVEAAYKSASPLRYSVKTVTKGDKTYHNIVDVSVIPVDAMPDEPADPTMTEDGQEQMF